MTFPQLSAYGIGWLDNRKGHTTCPYHPHDIDDIETASQGHTIYAADQWWKGWNDAHKERG